MGLLSRSMLLASLLVTIAVSGAVATGAATGPGLVYRTVASLNDPTWSSSCPFEVYSLSTSQVGLPTVSSATVEDPAWSPDGKWVAFSSGPQLCTNGDGLGQASAQIWLVATGGGSLLRVTTPDHVSGSVDRSPSWSPDGRRIAFARSGPTSGQSGIYTVGRDGRGLTRISPQTALSLDWSPDGRRIAFVGGRWETFGYSQRSTVRVLDARTGDVAATAGVKGAVDIAWSPDGRLLAVTGDGVLLLLTSRGAIVRRIAVGAPGRSPLDGVTWSPEGRTLAYGDGGAVFTVGADGRGRRQVVTGPARSGSPDWEP